MDQGLPGRKALAFLICAWPLVMVVPLVHVPLPMFVAGHPWRAELALALYAVALTGTVIVIRSFGYTFSPSLLRAAERFGGFIAAFGVLGLLSAFWAGSWVSVANHTLVWALYLTFFAAAAMLVGDRRLLRGTLLAVGAVSAVYCGTCAAEYFLRPSLDQTFGFRYARYAEISAALLPLFASLTLRLKGRNFALAIFAFGALWLQVICSQSRTAFIAALLGLGIFAGFELLADRSRLQFKKAAAIFGLLIAIGLLAQLPAVISQERSGALARFNTSAESDASNSIGQNVRLQFIGVGTEMVRDNLWKGVGADNFGLEYNKYRAVYSADPANRSIAAYGEDGLPERAHNEYLQVLAESGIFGLLLFAAMLVFVLFMGFRLIQRHADSRYAIPRAAAFAGIVAFLASSAFSSFSFRLGQNGVVFFFLAALLLKGPGKSTEANTVLPRAVLPVLFVLSLSALALFSARGYSQYLVNAAERTPNMTEAAAGFDRALSFDPSNAPAHFSWGMRLLGETDYPNSARQFRLAVDKGINNVTTYSYLISAQYLSGDIQAARDTAAEAVSIFPYSAFAQTRLALLENELGDRQAAEVHFAKAAEIDAKSAVTWRLLIGSGARAAAEAGRRGEGVDVLYNLQPQNAMWAVITERQIRFPDEKFKFPTAADR